MLTPRKKEFKFHTLNIEMTSTSTIEKGQASKVSDMQFICNEVVKLPKFKDYLEITMKSDASSVLSSWLLWFMMLGHAICEKLVKYVI